MASSGHGHQPDPSAEDATAIQFVAGALVCPHVVPALVEIKINCPSMAIILFPSTGNATATAA